MTDLTTVAASETDLAVVEALIADIRSCLSELGNALKPKLFPNDDNSSAPSSHWLTSFAELMERDVAAITTCTRELERYARSDAAPRRDDAHATLRHGIMRVRTLLTAAHGAQALRLSGLDGRIPEQADALLEYSDRAIRMLKHAAHAYSTPASFASFDFTEAARFIHGHAGSLQVILDTDDTQAIERAEAHHAQLVERCMSHRDTALALIDALAPMASMSDRAEAVRRRANAVNLPDALALPELRVEPTPCAPVTGLA